MIIAFSFFSQEPKIYNPNGFPKICAIDCGMKFNQIRCFLQRNVRLEVVPWNTSYAKGFNFFDYDGIFISNGPGDPKMCKETVENLKILLSEMDKKKVVIPIFGICLGHQLLSVAAGFNTTKMRFVTKNFMHFCK